jgi:hypothetical protein
MLRRGFRPVKGRSYGHILERFVRKSFPLFERFGFHVSLNHFYEPIPDTRTLKDELWLKQSSLVGVEIDDEEIVRLLSEFRAKYKEEYDRFPRKESGDPFAYYFYNETFGSVDGEIYYSMIRHFRPKRIIEIGCGKSTLLASKAVLKNMEDQENVQLLGVEPYPSEVMRRGFPGLSELRECKAQDVEIDEFLELEANDILFVDSSHVLKIGSDVQYIFLEVLPRLKKGVLVHFHDVFLPLEYPKEWVLGERKFWNEQYFLHAFLISNKAFEVLWPGNYMHLRHPQELEKAFGSYDREFVVPGSFWMRNRSQ